MNREAIQQYCDRAEACPKETLEGCVHALRYIDKAITLLLRDGVREADASYVRVCALAHRVEVLTVARHAARRAKARSIVDALTNYDVLGLDRDFSRDALKRSYRELALQVHPDRNSQDALCVEAFQRLTQAHDVLSDPTKRRAYDMTLHPLPSSLAQFLLPSKSQPPPPEPQPPAPKKKCDHCDALCFVAHKRCPSCGFEFVRKRSKPTEKDSSVSKGSTTPPRTGQLKKKQRVCPEDDDVAEPSYASRADRCYEHVRTGSMQLVQFLEANAPQLQVDRNLQVDLEFLTRVTGESALLSDFLRHAAELEQRANALLLIAERMPKGFEYPYTPGLREALPFLRMHMTRITIERNCGSSEERPKEPSAKRPPHDAALFDEPAMCKQPNKSESLGRLEVQKVENGAQIEWQQDTRTISGKKMYARDVKTIQVTKPESNKAMVQIVAKSDAKHIFNFLVPGSDFKVRPYQLSAPVGLSPPLPVPAWLSGAGLPRERVPLQRHHPALHDL